MRNTVLLSLLASIVLPCNAQRVLSLDSCRAMALRTNKQVAVARMKQDVATNTRRAARTKYLPKVDAVGGYELLSKEVSLLNDDQKAALNNLGTNLVNGMSGSLTQTITGLAQQGLITPQQAQAFGQMASQSMPQLANTLNGVGTDIRRAFRTNNRNMMGLSVMVRQPVYLGGAITAANRIADINEQMMAHSADNIVQNTLYNVDQTYWLVVSLNQKNKLARSFLDLVTKLNSDVQKLIREGFATRADGLKVSVKVNEAEMAVTQAEDGLALARMLLCQQCGLPMDSQIVLEDENRDQLSAVSAADPDMGVETAWENRTELKLLGHAIDISRETTKLVRAAYLPQVAVVGGYMLTNPNVYNGFEKRFSGVWNIGLMVRVPIWNWQEGAYKVRATRAATSIASLELDEARELIELQVSQEQFKVKEANKKYGMSLKNVEKAEENLRCANLGFAEGVMSATEVMEAQTAWLQAQTQKIDAEIDVRLTQVGLKKALGVLN
ncbi:MAG: TolC family protein [Prevotella sp.]|nr:TolC family protein [Prevotella sp.]